MSKDTLSFRTLTGFQILILLFALTPNLLAQKTKKPLIGLANNTPITINTTSGVTAPIKGSLYPSTIEVTGISEPVEQVFVTLNGVNHTAMSNLDMLLVSPNGEKYIFLADGGPIFAQVDDKVYTFADSASETLPFIPAPSGTYKPTSGDNSADTFPAPAPAGPYNQAPNDTFASSFGGTIANGTWSLYAVDDSTFRPGSINEGWTLGISTSNQFTSISSSDYIGFDDVLAQSDPYGTSINVSGQTGVISDINVTLNGFLHDFPGDVNILLVDPNGKGVILMSDINVNSPTASVTLTFDDSAPTFLTNFVTGTYKPTDGSSSSLVDTFPIPAPIRPHSDNGRNQLSKYNGFSPNGTWRLFVVDDSPSNAGSIAGGWSLDITTTPVVPPTGGNCSDPSFTTSSFSTGNSPANLAVVDLNNDSIPDLAVANQVSNDVSILLGNGDGTFAPQALVSVGSSPYGIVAGKFNNDNDFDLAVTNSSDNNVSILLGNGDGTFAAGGNFFVGSNPISIATGDFNNDSNTDLVVANFGGFFSGMVSILLGTGTGSFTNGRSVRTRTQPAFVEVGRLNQDANDDIIVANFGSDSVSTFLGDGGGNFQLLQNILGGQGPVALELADLSNDGIADLSIASYNEDSVRTCLGNSNGTFNSCFTNQAGANPISIAAADFNLDGVKSIATAFSGSDLVKVLTNTISVGQSPNDMETADLNSDGNIDLVSANFGSNDVSVMLNNCQLASGNLFDYDGDRRTDYAIFRPSTESYYVSSLSQNSAAQIFGRPTDRLVPADYNGDGLTDFGFYRKGNWHIVDRFSNPIYYTEFGLEDDITVPADYDGDGKADIAVWRPSDGNWYIRRSTDNAMQVVTFGTAGDKPVAVDYDGDGTDDIAVYRPSNGVWYIMRSSDGQVTINQFGISEDRTVPADYDGDGKADQSVWRPSNSVWYVRKSSDNGFIIVNFGLSDDVPVIGDFEGDGKYDFAVWRPSDGVWYVRKSSDGGTIFFPYGLMEDLPTPSAYVR